MANNFKINCDASRDNTGLSKYCQDIGTIGGYWKCPWDYSIDTEDLAKVEATIIAAINAPKSERVYPFPAVFLMEDNSEEAVYQEGSVNSLFVRDGKVNYAMTHESSRYKHAALKTHTNDKCSVYLIDQQGRLHGVTSDGTKFEAINIETFTVEKLMVNDGTNATTTKVTMIFADSYKFQTNPAVVIPTDYNAKDIEGLFDVVLSEEGTPTTTEVIVAAEYNKTSDGVVGLSETPGEDWTVKDSLGVETAPTSITDNEDGTYTFAFAALTPGEFTFDLLAPSVMTTKGFESKAALTVTIA